MTISTPPGNSRTGPHAAHRPGHTQRATRRGATACDTDGKAANEGFSLLPCLALFALSVVSVYLVDQSELCVPAPGRLRGAPAAVLCPMTCSHQSEPVFGSVNSSAAATSDQSDQRAEGREQRERHASIGVRTEYSEKQRVQSADE
jgi:hypothetical protein